MKKHQFLLTLSLFLSSFFSLAASSIAHDFSEKVHIGVRSENTSISYLVDQLKSIELHQVTEEYFQYDALGSTVRPGSAGNQSFTMGDELVVGGVRQPLPNKVSKLSPKLQVLKEKYAAYKDAGGSLGIGDWAKRTRSQSWGIGARQTGFMNHVKSVRGHGNFAGDQPAALYAKFDKDNNFLKWGVTKYVNNPAKRYPTNSYINSKGKFIDGIDDGVILRIGVGKRSELIQAERFLSERFPGGANLENWAGDNLILPGIFLFP